MNDTVNILQKALEDLGGTKEGPTAQEIWYSQLSKGLDPDFSETAVDTTYQDNPVGYIRDILGVKRLTDDQIRLCNAVRDYEAVIVISATGTGKTFILACLAVWAYKTHEHVSVWTTAAQPISNLKDLLWGEIGLIQSKRPHLFQNDRTTSLRIERAKKQHIVGLSIPGQGKEEDIEAKFSGKHQENQFFFVDEGDAVPDPVYRGIDGCTSGGKQRLVICYNPKKRSGEPYEMIKEGRAKVIEMSAFNHPNVVTGHNLIRGAVTREVTMRRINEWTEPLSRYEQETPDISCFEVPEYLVGEVAHAQNGKPYPPLQAGWRKIVDQQFAYKVLGRYPAEGENQLIPDQYIDAAVSRWEMFNAQNGGKPPQGLQPIMGLDVADEGDDMSVATFRYGLYVALPEAWGGIDPDLTGERGARLYKEHNARQVNVDAIGVGAGVAQKMTRYGRTMIPPISINAAPIVVNEKSLGYSEDGEFYELGDEAYWNMRKWFMLDQPMIPPEKKLIDALRMLSYDTNNSRRAIRIVSRKIMRTKLGHSPDHCSSLMLTFAPATTDFGGV
jgi:hypothetical protein